MNGDLLETGVLPADVNEISANKERIHVLEGALITWTKQIKAVLKQDPEQLLKVRLLTKIRARPLARPPAGWLAGWLAGETKSLIFILKTLNLLYAPSWKFPRNIRFGTGPTHLVRE